MAISLRELVCENRGDEITTNVDTTGTLDGLPCDGSVGGMVGEAISQKVYKAVGLAVELVDSFWELVGNNRGKEIATNDDRAGTAVELPCLDSLGGIVGEALSQKNGEAVAISLRELVSENRGDEITTMMTKQKHSMAIHVMVQLEGR